MVFGQHGTLLLGLRFVGLLLTRKQLLHELMASGLPNGVAFPDGLGD